MKYCTLVLIILSHISLWANDRDLIYAALEKIIILEQTVKNLEQKVSELEKKISKLEQGQNNVADNSSNVSSQVAREIELIKQKLANDNKINNKETDTGNSVNDSANNSTNTTIDQSGNAIPGFRYIGSKQYTCEEKTNTVQEYVHEETGIEFVLVPGGTYKRGSSYGQENEKPIHKVTLNSFLISKYEVTQLSWQNIMKSNPSYFKDKHKPVEKISWEDAQLFCERTGLRLPSEGEWEYAYRAGTTSEYFWGSQEADEYAWFWENGSRTTHRVGSKKANAFGLFDMSGNVMEWCYDIYEEYANKEVTNPRGAEKGLDRIIRGGSWYNDIKECRGAYRFRKAATHFNFNIGFRVCASLQK